MSQATNLDRMLVLDDDVELGDMIGELGRRSGFEPAVTSTAERFSEELGRAIPDLIVLDLQMPKADGIEILRELAASEVQSSILLVSGMDKRTVASAEHFGRHAGLNVIGTLQKPFSPEAMIDQLSKSRGFNRRLTSEDLSQAIQSGQLTLQYQPVIHRFQPAVWHPESAEALIRWQHPTLGLLIPSQFLNLIDSDRGELMKQLTDFVFERGVEQLRAWQDAGHHIGLRVNVSAGLIADSRFPDRLESLLHEHDTDPQLLTIEIREASALGPTSKGSDILTRLRLKSINLSLDDFGAVGTSLDTLYTLPFGEIKIDRCLISDIANSSGAATLVSGLVDVAHRMDMSCCAVGIETVEQLRLIDSINCDRAQGFYIGAPVTPKQLPELLANWTKSTREGETASGQGTQPRTHSL